MRVVQLTQVETLMGWISRYLYAECEGEVCLVLRVCFTEDHYSDLLLLYRPLLTAVTLFLSGNSSVPLIHYACDP